MLVWDGLAVLKDDNKHLFLIEAKAHLQETNSEMLAGNPQSIRKIASTLSAVKKYMGVPDSKNWQKPYYQFCNRLAFLYFFHVLLKHPTSLYSV